MTANIINFDNIINRYAKNEYKIWNFSKEFRTAIIVTVCLNVATMIVNVYSSYYEVFTILLPLVGNQTAGIFFSVLSIVLIEILTLTALSKCFKFFFRKRYEIAISAGLAAILFYSISFITATNGLALRRSEKVDQTKMIVDNNQTEVANIKADYRSRIEKLEADITTIKANPQGWTRNKRDVLLANQLSDIKQYNIQIADLRAQMKQEIDKINQTKDVSLQQNEITTGQEASKYYRIVAIIMILQFLSRGLMVLFWRCIYVENDRKELMREDIQHLKLSLLNSMWNTVKTETIDMQRLVLNTFSIQSMMFDANQTTSGETKNKQIVGFKIPDKTLPEANETVIKTIPPVTAPALPDADQTNLNNETVIKKDETLPVPAPINPNATEKSNKVVINDSLIAGNEIMRYNESDSIGGDNIPPDNNESAKVKTPKVKNCLSCGKEFIPYSIVHKYCSDNCRLDWHKKNGGFDLRLKLQKNKK